MPTPARLRMGPEVPGMTYIDVLGALTLPCLSFNANYQFGTLTMPGSSAYTIQRHFWSSQGYTGKDRHPGFFTW
jgi:hypothetical protein